MRRAGDGRQVQRLAADALERQPREGHGLGVARRDAQGVRGQYRTGGCELGDACREALAEPPLEGDRPRRLRDDPYCF